MSLIADPSRDGETRRLLRWVAIVAVIDLALFIPLVIAAVGEADGVVSVLGPLHGIGFLLELFLVVRGAVERLWGWWFPAIVLVTTGPPGALIGHVRITRALDAARLQAAAATA